ncbi:MAG: hypothetical protein JJ895_05615 [Balneolaceae bacterium]|nr:hypothetical protein [Balneolaceae bacterium]
MKKKPAALLFNILFIEQGIELLEEISDKLYTRQNGTYHKSGIGRHFRHIIEHYYSLIEADFCGQINYDDRERNLRLENDREFMITSLKRVNDSLKKLEETPDRLFNKISVISNEGLKDADQIASESSVLRELQFLISHTVHHYALIGLILRTHGFNPKDDFGVAPSTLAHEKRKESVEKAS